MAETFAAALLALHADTEPEQLEVPVAWLLGIARNKLYESYRRGRVEAAARQRLHLEPLVLDDNDLALVDELSETDLVKQLADVLPPDQLEALRLRSSTSATTTRSRATCSARRPSCASASAARSHPASAGEPIP